MEEDGGILQQQRSTETITELHSIIKLKHESQHQPTWRVFRISCIRFLSFFQWILSGFDLNCTKVNSHLTQNEGKGCNYKIYMLIHSFRLKYCCINFISETFIQSDTPASQTIPDRMESAGPTGKHKISIYGECINIYHIS